MKYALKRGEAMTVLFCRSLIEIKFDQKKSETSSLQRRKEPTLVCAFIEKFFVTLGPDHPQTTSLYY